MCVAVKEAVNRAGIKPEDVDEVIFDITTGGQLERLLDKLLLKLNYRKTSSLIVVVQVRTISLSSVISWSADCVVAGGTENMSLVSCSNVDGSKEEKNHQYDRS